ncbi:DUF6503 family protein [Psychroserpens damuponensis]|uniref:DUF6503 family protein n=1 Tax=Psychroserpens damuponensis TaxID=943936 RepID=UPI000590982C|nr:DUF6503 family protein [Psychroserpens damuponensis]
MKYISLVLLTMVLFNCNNVKKDVSEEKQTAQSVIDSSIIIAGVDKLHTSTIEFDFRNTHYLATRDKGIFSLERHFVDDKAMHLDTVSNVRDVVNNKGFQRYVNNFPMAVVDSMAVKYAASVNSVHYFSVLPFGLNDNAVNKTLLEDVTIKQNTYKTVKVTFDQDGGGEDFEDVFMYWVNVETNNVDFLAYSYNEVNGKGIRFREAFNERYIEGVRFVDYNNYKPKDHTVLLAELPQLFESGKLLLLSKIELENIAVRLN